MANLLQDKQDSDLNPGDADYRRRVDGSHDRNPDLNDLQRKEEAGNLEDAFNRPSADDPKKDNPVDKARQDEDSPGYKNNFTGSNNKQNGSKFSLKRKGPAGGLIALILGGGFGVAGIFGGPSLLIQQVYETFTGNPSINTQLTSMSARAGQMIASKFRGGGTCTTITIICKETRLSNYELQAMKENGITVTDTSGKPMTGDGSTPNTAEAGEVTINDDGTGRPLTIRASDVGTEFNDDAAFRNALDKVYNTRGVSLEDSVFAEIKERFGFNGTDPIKDEDASKINDDVDKEAVGESTSDTSGSSTSTSESGSSSENSELNTAISDGGAATTGTPSAATTEISGIIEHDIEDSLKNVGGDGEKDASGIAIAAGVACAAADVPGMVVKAVRAYQLAQVIRYASVFLIVAGAIRAGDATPTEVAALGALLTIVVSTGKGPGTSAMDSFGMRNAMYGDTAFGSDSKSLWSRFSPGASISNSAWGTVASIFSSGVKQDFCSVATSPVTQDAIDTGADATIVGGIINTVVGVGAGVGLSEFAGPIASAVASAIPPSVEADVLSAIAGDAISGLDGGMGVGDALASGSENMMSQTANAGGNMPLTVTQAVAYNQVTQRVATQYAEDDRLTYSPLDASNPNTALGSFVNQFMPYYADMSSVSGIFSMVGNIVGSSFGTILSPVVAQAADPTAAFTQCDDPAIAGSETAATPFCAIDYGIPAQYLNTSPTDVTDALIQSGDIDSTSGNTNSASSTVQSTISTVFGTSTTQGVPTNLDDWTKMCTDGTTTPIADSSTNNCAITNQQTADYALYTVDKRVQQTMDGEDTTLTTGVSSVTNNSSTATPTSSAYNSSSSTSQLLAMLNSFNQPQPTTPTVIPNIIPIHTTSPIIADLKNTFTSALPVKRYTGITA